MAKCRDRQGFHGFCRPGRRSGYLRDASPGSDSLLEDSIWNILYSHGIRNFGGTTFSPIRASYGAGSGETLQEEKAMLESRRMVWVAIGVLAILAVPGGAVFGGAADPVLLADMDGGGGGDMNIDLAVRQVTVTPVRAHVGDVIHVDMVIENKAEGSQTTPAELLVNGKVVSSHLFTWGMSPGERLYRVSFDWDTRGVSPGEYRIGAQADVWGDSSPFDNRLNVTQPVRIAPVGGGFPGGKRRAAVRRRRIRGSINRASTDNVVFLPPPPADPNAGCHPKQGGRSCARNRVGSGRDD